MRYGITEERVKLLGRSFEQNGVQWFALSGAGIAFVFRGKKLCLDLVGDNTTQGFETEGKARIGIYIDGVRKLDFLQENPAQRITCIESAQEVQAEIRVVKLSEAPMSMFGIRAIETDEEALIKPLAHRQRRIEFIGDSITCGFGVDLEDPDTVFTTETEDVTRAYAYKMAEKLSADYSMVCFSGFGVLTGYTEENQIKAESTVPLYYEKMGYSDARTPEGGRPQDMDWDFSRFVPDLIVVNLGTNDDSYCRDIADRQEQFQESYVAFLQQIRRNNPKARILCVVGVMGERIVPSMQKAVQEYCRLTKDAGVWARGLTEQRPEDGLVTCSHPTERTHEKTAVSLTETVKQIMSW